MQNITDRHNETGGWSIDELHRQFGEVLSWLESLGVDYERGRFAHYVEQLGILINARSDGNVKTSTKIEQDQWSWFHEMFVLLDIYKARGRIGPSRVLRQKLEQVCTGTLREAEEQAGRTLSRDIQWELLVSAKISSSGHRACLESSIHSNLPVDVSFVRQRTIALVECKRVASEDALLNRFKAGLGQLGNMKGDITRWVPRRGIVAFDVSALAFPELHGEPYESIQAEFNRYQDRHQEIMERMLRRLIGQPNIGGVEGYQRRYSRIACFIFRSVSYRLRKRDNRKMFLQFWTVVANNNATSQRDIDWARSLANAWHI